MQRRRPEEVSRLNAENFGEHRKAVQTNPQFGSLDGRQGAHRQVHALGKLLLGETKFDAPTADVGCNAFKQQLEAAAAAHPQRVSVVLLTKKEVTSPNTE